MKIIRFRIKGNKFNHLFDIVVCQKKKRSRGFFFDKIGFFNPQNVRFFWINFKKLGYWLNKGAILHPTVKKYLLKFVLIYVK